MIRKTLAHRLRRQRLLLLVLNVVLAVIMQETLAWATVGIAAASQSWSGSDYAVRANEITESRSIAIGTLTSNGVITDTGFAVYNDRFGVSGVSGNFGDFIGHYSQRAGATSQMAGVNSVMAANTDSGYGRLAVLGNATIGVASLVSLDDSMGSFYDLAIVLSAPTSKLAPMSATVPHAVAALTGLSYCAKISSSTLLNLYDASLTLDQEGGNATNPRGGQLNPVPSVLMSSAVIASDLDVFDIVSAHANGMRLAQADGVGGVSAGEDLPVHGVWGQAYGGHVCQDECDQVDGYNANFGGRLFEVGHALSATWRVGGVFSYRSMVINSTGDTVGETLLDVNNRA